jgi:hypothetical protein
MICESFMFADMQAGVSHDTDDGQLKWILLPAESLAGQSI